MMISKELQTKMDKLCDGWGESCAGCPCRDLDVCNSPEDNLTDEDYREGIEAFESLKKDKVGESAADDAKVPLHATEQPTHGSEYDAVKHPRHYASTTIECIDAMRETQGDDVVKGWLLGSAFKYLWRHRFKNGEEDIAKASQCLNEYMEITEGEST